jgi:hypothetical protein
MRSSRWLPVVASVAVPVGLTALLVPFRESVSSANLALVLVVGVVVVAATGNRTAAFVGAAVTALSYDVFLTRPYNSPAIASPAELFTAFLLLAVGLSVGVIASWARRQRAVAVDREADLGLLYHVIDQVAGCASTESLIAMAEREIAQLLGAEAVRFDTGPTETIGSIDRVGTVYVGDVRWPVAEVGLPGGPLLVPLQSGGLPLGAFVVRSQATHRVQTWQLVMAVMIADLIATALARWPSDV